jgi:hypothetical protein
MSTVPVYRPTKSAPDPYAPVAPWRCFVAKLTSTLYEFGRWHSDAIIRYLHIQAQPVMLNFAATMFNNGTYEFLPDEMVPVNDVDHDE